MMTTEKEERNRRDREEGARRRIRKEEQDIRDQMEALQSSLDQLESKREAAGGRAWKIFNDHLTHQYRMMHYDYHHPVYWRGDEVSQFVRVEYRVHPQHKPTYDKLLTRYQSGPTLDWEWNGMAYAVYASNIVGSISGGFCTLSPLHDFWWEKGKEQLEEVERDTKRLKKVEDHLLEVLAGDTYEWEE